MKEEVKEASDGTLEQGDFKIKKKPKKLANKKPTKATKLDLSKKEEPKKEEKDAIPVGETKKVSMGEPSGDSGKVDEPVRVDTTENEVKKEELQKPQIEEITEIEVKDTKQPVEEEVVKEVVKQDRVLPENIEKLVNFMEDTGGTVEDYVRINADYTNIDENVLLREYYKNVKPHLNSEEIDFILEDSFSWDEDLDEDRHIKKKKLAYKEEIAKARNFLEDTKSKYYDEIKLRPSQTQEQKKATEFFNRYNTEQQRANELHKEFVNKTNKLFNEFEGFDFNVGEKKFRYKINNTEEIAKSQSNINNFVGKFLNEDGSVKDHANYHKAIYAAKNVDSIAEHFYEQGKADAIRDVNAKSKNIDIKPAKQADGDIFIGGMKVKAISGVDSSKLKIKTRNKN
jgi:hypothetical protein